MPSSAIRLILAGWLRSRESRCRYLSPWALLLAGVSWLFQFQRMTYEERVLLQSFPDYKDYMARTARLVPGVY